MPYSIILKKQAYFLLVKKITTFKKNISIAPLRWVNSKFLLVSPFRMLANRECFSQHYTNKISEYLQSSNLDIFLIDSFTSCKPACPKYTTVRCTRLSCCIQTSLHTENTVWPQHFQNFQRKNHTGKHSLVKLAPCCRYPHIFRSLTILFAAHKNTLTHILRYDPRISLTWEFFRICTIRSYVCVKMKHFPT